MANTFKTLLVLLVVISLVGLCGCKDAVNININGNDTTVNTNNPSTPGADNGGNTPANPDTDPSTPTVTTPLGGEEFEGDIDVFEDPEASSPESGNVTEGTEQPSDPTEPSSGATDPSDPTDPTDPVSDPTNPGETEPSISKPGNQGGVNEDGAIELPMIPG